MPIYLEVILVFVWVYLWVYLLWAVGVTYIEILTIFTRCLLNSIGVLLIEHLDLHYFIGWTLQKEKISTCCHVCNVFHLQRSFLHAYFEHGDTRGCFPDTRSFGSELVSYCFGSHVQRLAASCERFPILGMGKNSENQQKGNHPIERMDDCWLDWTCFFLQRSRWPAGSPRKHWSTICKSAKGGGVVNWSIKCTEFGSESSHPWKSSHVLMCCDMIDLSTRHDSWPVVVQSLIFRSWHGPSSTGHGTKHRTSGIKGDADL